MRVTKMPYIRPVNGKLQIKVDIPARLRPFFEWKSALTRFHKTGENVPEIVGKFHHAIKAAQRKLDGAAVTNSDIPEGDRRLSTATSRARWGCSGCGLFGSEILR